MTPSDETDRLSIQFSDLTIKVETMDMNWEGSDRQKAYFSPSDTAQFELL